TSIHAPAVIVSTKTHRRPYWATDRCRGLWARPVALLLGLPAILMQVCFVYAESQKTEPWKSSASASASLCAVMLCAIFALRSGVYILPKNLLATMESD